MVDVGLLAIQSRRDPLLLPSLISALSLPHQLPTATLYPSGVDGNTWPPLFLSFPLFPPWIPAPWSAFKGQIGLHSPTV